VGRSVRIFAAVLFVCLVSLELPAQQDDRAIRRERNLKARAHWRRADARRMKKQYEDARKDYEDAASLWEANGNRNFSTVTRLMVDLCTTITELNVKKLKNGEYQGTARGYSGDITVAVRLKNGRVVNFAVTNHRESRPLKSLEILPTAIGRKQSPSVDAVSGATVTSYGVMAATLQALERAKPGADE